MIAYVENLKQRLGEEFAVYTELLKLTLHLILAPNMTFFSYTVS